MKKITSLLCLLLAAINIMAGDFEWQAQIDSVPKDGFFKILLSPGIIWATNPDYSDIRVFDPKRQEIPYILTAEHQETTSIGFKEYKILENQYLAKKGVTRIVVHNQQKIVISSLHLIMQKSDVEKEITLKGSDDLKNWYIIKRTYPVRSDYFEDETSEMMVIDFPNNNYEYLELQLSDKKKDQLKVIKIGWFDSQIVNGLYTEVPLPIIKQVDSVKAKKSYITLMFNHPYEISKLEFRVKGPDLYFRNCLLGTYRTKRNKLIFDELGWFNISSTNAPVWKFDKIKTNKLNIIIENFDNAPLRFKQVKAYQLNKYLIAYLKANKQYHLVYGKKDIAAPEYDLKYFADTISNCMMIIKTGKPVKMNEAAAHPVSFIFNKTILWIIIGVIIVLLAWVSIRLAREVGKRK